MRLEADLHCHTLATGHAYSTLQECVHEAAKKEIKLIAITDHGIQVPDAPKLIYFLNIKTIPEEIEGVRVLRGVEANILDYEGTIDMPEKVLDRMDIVIASMHDICIECGTKAQNTQAIVRAIQNPYVDIIGHPDNPLYEVDYEEIAAAAAEYGKMLEINSHSPIVRRGCEKNTYKLAEMALKYKTMISCGSDAHISFNVGNFEYAQTIINDLNIPEELIINTTKEKVLQYIMQRRRK